MHIICTSQPYLIDTQHKAKNNQPTRETGTLLFGFITYCLTFIHTKLIVYKVDNKGRHETPNIYTMDILNDNDDTNMEDSANNNNDNNADSSLNDNNSNREGDVINHERLRALSNYADQNQDNPSWYWNTPGTAGNVAQQPPAGWSVYRPLSNLSDLERKDIRKGETRMISYKDPELYEGTGISLDWGEYYVADDEMDNSDDEQSSLSSFEEEAEETNDEELKEEKKQAVLLAVNINTSQEPPVEF